ncbi:MAG: TIGR00730 family Rossman fold protein [Bacteroidia bacterium]
MKNIQSVLVYCGAAKGNKSEYANAAVQLAELFCEQNIRLIYGGGSVGLMGVLADTMLENGGAVTGVIPEFLFNKEVAHAGVKDMRVVSSMHERKALMEQMADAVIALPGGFGTMDELFEMLTWAQLGLHEKPIGLLNTNGFYSAFMSHLDMMVREGFLNEINRELLVSASTPALLIDQIRKYKVSPSLKLLDRNQT